MDIKDFSRQVLHNCDISDAKFAGIYSICGLAMRLRDLYKWEKGVPVWQEGDAHKVLDWIGEKEDFWESLSNEDFTQLALNGNRFDPFDSLGINLALRPHGLFYGAGYAHSLKPTFFLAKIASEGSVAGHKVWNLGREYARDLLTLPAFSQDGEIVLRREAGRMFLWDQIAYINQSGRKPLAMAMQACGLPNPEPETIRRHINKILDVQQSVYLWHEVGELEEQIFDRNTWRQLLSDHPHTPVELFVRSLKDVLADTGTHGALTHLIAERNKAALGLYLAFVKGLFPVLCKELVCAFHQFLADPQWELLISAKQNIRQIVVDLTHHVIEIHQQGQQKQDMQWTRATIEELMREHKLISK